MHTGKRIAVIGGGIAGISASYILQNRYYVSLFERAPKLGGHTNTHRIVEPSGREVFVDSGFIVFNERNYPNFSRFLSELKVDSQESNMSFSYHAPNSDFYYAGIDLDGLFAQRKNLLRGSFWKMLRDIPKFYSEGENFLAKGNEESLEDFLKNRGFSTEFINNYLIPMGAAIWSTPHEEMMKFPAASFLNFWKNHGLLSLINRPQWKTIAGGSHRYVHQFEQQFRGAIYKNAQISDLDRSSKHIRFKMNGESFEFDALVVAVHADQVLGLLDDADSVEKKLFSIWSYSKNPTVLHFDSSVLPPKKSAWASWNYTELSPSKVSVSYYMNRLQRLQSSREYCVSLNWPDKLLNQKRILEKIEYEHPTYSTESVKTQNSIRELSGHKNTYYCGSYLGHGFHEDAFRSSVDMAKKLGVYW